jgi:hypothetical protein
MSFGVAEGLWAPARDSEGRSRRAEQRHYRVARGCHPLAATVHRVFDVRECGFGSAVIS